MKFLCKKKLLIGLAIFAIFLSFVFFSCKQASGSNISTGSSGGFYKTKYNINFINQEHVKITAIIGGESKELSGSLQVEEGARIVFNAIVESGYAVDSWIGEGLVQDSKNPNSASLTVTKTVNISLSIREASLDFTSMYMKYEGFNEDESLADVKSYIIIVGEDFTEEVCTNCTLEVPFNTENTTLSNFTLVNDRLLKIECPMPKDVDTRSQQVVFKHNTQEKLSKHFYNFRVKHDGSIVVKRNEFGCYGDKPTGTLEIPEGILSIGNEAFKSCRDISSLKLPDSLTTIGKSAFYGCNKLESVNFSNNLKKINNNAFNNCTELKDLTFPASLTYIGTGAFAYCKKLEILNFFDSLMEIEQSAFKECIGLTSVHLPENLKVINLSVFEGCNKLESINLPKTLEKIGYSAFKNCASLNINVDFTHLNKLKSISGFENCENLKGELKLPKNLTDIELDAFRGCSGLNGNLKLPENLSYIGYWAFKDCKNLTGDLKFPNSITSIGWDAFSGCENLDGTIIFPKNNKFTRVSSECLAQSNIKKVVLPGNITVIEKRAFKECLNLKEVVIKGKLTECEVSSGEDPFYECSPEIKIYVISEVVKKVLTDAEISGDKIKVDPSIAD